jgi:VanZ family protein
MRMPIEARAERGARFLDGLQSLSFSQVFYPRLWIYLWAIMTTLTTVLYLLPDAGPPGRAHLDTIAHLMAFGAIGFSGFLGSGRLYVGAPLLVSLLLAMILEWLQSFVPGREYAMSDWAANLVGLGMGVAVALGFRILACRLLDRSA